TTLLFVGFGGFRRTLCSNGFADLLNGSASVGEGFPYRGLKRLAGFLQCLGGVLLYRFQIRDSAFQILLCNLVLHGNGRFDRLRDRVRRLPNSLNVGLDGATAPGGGITDRSM